MRRKSVNLPNPLKLLQNQQRQGSVRQDPSLGLRLFDGLAASFSLWVALHLSPVTVSGGVFQLEGKWPFLYWIVGIGWPLWLLEKHQAYRWPYRGVWPWSRYQVVEITLGLSAFWVGVALLHPAPQGISWLTTGAEHVVFLFLSLTVGRSCLQGLLLGGRKTQFQERVIFVGRNQRMERVLQEAANKMGAWQVVLGYLENRDSSKADRCYRPLGMVKDAPKIFLQERPTLLLIDQNGLSETERSRLAKLCVLEGVRLKIIPENFDFWVDHGEAVPVAGIPVAGTINDRYDLPWNRAWKRGMDLLGSGFGLVILSPLFLMLALLIRIDSPGPTLIRQRRLGRNGREFWIVKFRSMKAGSELDPQQWAHDNDARFTCVGKVLREWNLDELPQLWNVWVGEMSLVGPRPEMADLVLDFTTSIHSYALRLRMKPGMTGWAAVHGFRGNTSLQERIDHDLFYIQNWSWKLDWIILLMTLVPQGGRKRSAKDSVHQ